jgi:MerR family copper efflux transcriptional regulator
MLDLEPEFKVKAMAMLTIGKIARQTGFSASAIRYYERHGLLSPSRLLNGYRLYDQDAVKVLQFLQQAKKLGITLKEIKQLLELAHDGRHPCKGVREVARQHLRNIDETICQLRSLRKELRNLLSRRVSIRGDELCPLISSNPN